MSLAEGWPVKMRSWAWTPNRFSSGTAAATLSSWSRSACARVEAPVTSRARRRSEEERTHSLGRLDLHGRRYVAVQPEEERRAEMAELFRRGLQQHAVLHSVVEFRCFETPLARRSAAKASAHAARVSTSLQQVFGSH